MYFYNVFIDNFCSKHLRGLIPNLNNFLKEFIAYNNT